MPRRPIGQLLEIIHEVRRRWRMKLALRGAAIAAGCVAAALILSALGPPVDAVHAGIDPAVPHRARASSSRSGLRAARAAADAARHRRAGRDVSRGARAVARGRDHQRDRSRAAPAVRGGSRRRWFASWSRPRSRRCRAIDDGRRVERDAGAPLLGRAGGVLAIAAPRSSCSVPPTCAMRCRRCS